MMRVSHTLFVDYVPVNKYYLNYKYFPHEVNHLTIFKPVCFGWLVMDSLNLQGSTQSLNFRLRTVLPFANPGY